MRQSRLQLALGLATVLVMASNWAYACGCCINSQRSQQTQVFDLSQLDGLGFVEEQSDVNDSFPLASRVSGQFEAGMLQLSFVSADSVVRIVSFKLQPQASHLSMHLQHAFPTYTREGQFSTEGNWLYHEIKFIGELRLSTALKAQFGEAFTDSVELILYGNSNACFEPNQSTGLILNFGFNEYGQITRHSLRGKIQNNE